MIKVMQLMFMEKISGIVAMEDILEELVGEIEDEHDEEESLIRKNADGSYTMNGLASLLA